MFVFSISFLISILPSIRSSSWSRLLTISLCPSCLKYILRVSNSPNLLSSFCVKRNFYSLFLILGILVFNNYCWVHHQDKWVYMIEPYSLGEVVSRNSLFDSIIYAEAWRHSIFGGRYDCAWNRAEENYDKCFVTFVRLRRWTEKRI